MPLPSPFRSRADLELETTSMCLPGSSLPVSVRLRPHEQLKPRELRVELLGEETYYVRQTSVGPKGQTHTRVVKRVAAFSQIRKTVADNPILSPEFEQSWEATMAVPEDALPSCKGKIVDIHWTVKAILDVPGRPDALKETPVLIVVSGTPKENESGALTERQFDDCALYLESPESAGVGGSIKCRLRIKAERKFQVRGTRAELIRTEDGGARTHRETVSRQDIAGQSSFNPYEDLSFPISLALPPDAQPTSASPHSSLKWILRITLDRPLKKDFNVEREIVVYNTASA